MNRVAPFALWIGHGGEAGELTRLYENGVEAVVSLAVEEPPDRSPRDLIACRVPRVDGAGNRTERLALAVQTVATLLAAGVPTLVCCGAGMSRAPAVVFLVPTRSAMHYPQVSLGASLVGRVSRACEA